jgi:hypothetical protein
LDELAISTLTEWSLLQDKVVPFRRYKGSVVWEYAAKMSHVVKIREHLFKYNIGRAFDSWINFAREICNLIEVEMR